MDKNNKNQALVFHCMRQDPGEFDLLDSFGIDMSSAIPVKLPCSGRAGAGEILAGIAAGYEKIIVLGCGESSCRHTFGCREAKAAMERARAVGEIAGIKNGSVIFIEVDEMPKLLRKHETGAHKK